jgi:metal-dependent hydrolase (beta-lactamase superfamily II)
MKQTLTYSRLTALLLVSGVSVERVEQLGLKALEIAHDRHSNVLGGRHLLMAAGVMERAVTPERETPERSGGDPAASGRS